MKIKVALLLTLFCGTNFSNIGMNNNKYHNDVNLLSSIAEKYESPFVDPKVINFINFYADLNRSYFLSMMNNNLKLTFEISKTNASPKKFICYPDKTSHGAVAEKAYEKIIIQRSALLLEFNSMLTVIADVAHYYGDHSEIDQSLREQAINNDIFILSGMDVWFENHYSMRFTINNIYAEELRNLVNSKTSIINDVLAKNYDSDLFKLFYNLNYDNAYTSNNVLHKTDDYMSNIVLASSDHSQHPLEVADYYNLNFGRLIVLVIEKNYLYYSQDQKGNYFFILNDPYDFDLTFIYR